MTDLEIAGGHKPKKITEIAKAAGIKRKDLELYGDYKAKFTAKKAVRKGKLVLVTAVNPTPMGEGKTTISIGLADGLKRCGVNSGLALREPSLGPVFGVKGGATGGGYAQVVPMEDINLLFTGDIPAITAANNLLCALIDNHLFQGNSLNLDENKITFRRCVDLNDRCLRQIKIGIGEKNGVERSDGFDITAASEVMAVLCLSRDVEDLKKRLGSIIIGYNKNGNAVCAKDLKSENAMAILLKDAIKPNLVQTLEGTPAFIHGGPFANIAHGCNSIIATEAALSLFDYVVTEAGFGADLGAEKFLDVKCRLAELEVSAVVIVATVKALKYNGGALKEELQTENLAALKNGIPNLMKHIENIKDNFGLNCVVAVNRYSYDTEAELSLIQAECAKKGVKAEVCSVWADGGAGADTLAREIIRLSANPRKPKFTYELNDTIENKIEKTVKKIYGGKTVVFTDKAKEEIAGINRLKKGYENLPVIIAKTQYSLSQDPKLIGRPEGFDFTVRDIQLKAGAGFIVAICGDILLMPGLSKVPASENMKIKEKSGKHIIEGLF